MSVHANSLARRSVIHAAVAFIAMGGWAAFANRAHPMPAPLAAMLIQGTISATITLILKRTVERLARVFSGLPALAVPPVIACLLSAAVLATIHILAATPEVGWTIAVPLTVSSSYAALYSYSLWCSGKGA